MDQPTTLNAMEGRDPTTGRFVPGWRGGPGRGRGRMTALQEALRDAVEPEDIAAIARKLLHMALDGDVAAARLLLDRTLGLPHASVSVDVCEAWVLHCKEVSTDGVREGDIVARQIGDDMEVLPRSPAMSRRLV